MGDIEFKQRLELLRQKYSDKIGPILDNVDAMLKEAATQEYALRIDIAHLKGLPPPPPPAMLEPWTRSCVFDSRQYLHSIDAELSRLKK
jgi:hypothetical protein